MLKISAGVFVQIIRERIVDAIILIIPTASAVVSPPTEIAVTKIGKETADADSKIASGAKFFAPLFMCYSLYLFLASLSCTRMLF